MFTFQAILTTYVRLCLWINIFIINTTVGGFLHFWAWHWLKVIEFLLLLPNWYCNTPFLCCRCQFGACFISSEVYWKQQDAVSSYFGADFGNSVLKTDQINKNSNSLCNILYTGDFCLYFGYVLYWKINRNMSRHKENEDFLNS